MNVVVGFKICPIKLFLLFSKEKEIMIIYSLYSYFKIKKIK